MNVRNVFLQNELILMLTLLSGLESSVVKWNYEKDQKPDNVTYSFNYDPAEIKKVKAIGGTESNPTPGRKKRALLATAGLMDNPWKPPDGRTSYYFCKTLLGDGTIQVGKFNDIPLSPDNSGVPSLKALRDLPCCSDSSCLGCYEKSTQVLLIRKALKDGKTIHEFPVTTDSICVQCIQNNCDGGTCQNGEV